MSDISLKNKIKSYMALKGLSTQNVAELITEKYRPETLQNLSNKLRRGSIKYSEVEEIADVLGYNIEWIPKNE